MDEWLTKARDALAEAAGMPASELNLTHDEIVALLDLAALAAHESGDRRNAPLLCYLVGRVDRGSDLQRLSDAIDRSS
jgi:hypothetical protein